MEFLEAKKIHVICIHSSIYNSCKSLGKILNAAQHKMLRAKNLSGYLHYIWTPWGLKVSVVSCIYKHLSQLQPIGEYYDLGIHNYERQIFTNVESLVAKA